MGKLITDIDMSHGKGARMTCKHCRYPAPNRMVMKTHLKRAHNVVSGFHRHWEYIEGEA